MTSSAVAMMRMMQYRRCLGSSSCAISGTTSDNPFSSKLHTTRLSLTDNSLLLFSLLQKVAQVQHYFPRSSSIGGSWNTPFPIPLPSFLWVQHTHALWITAPVLFVSLIGRQVFCSWNTTGLEDWKVLTTHRNKINAIRRCMCVCENIYIYVYHVPRPSRIGFVSVK